MEENKIVSKDVSEKEVKLEEYKKTLTEIQKLALEIAEKHLGSSFDLSKSNGFLTFNVDD